MTRSYFDKLSTNGRKYLSSGDLFIWSSGAGLAISLLMVVGLLVLIMVNGLGYFWPANVIELTLADGTHALGQMAGREVIPKAITSSHSPVKARVRIKIGNRDLYGLDFKWVDEDKIVSKSTPPEAMLLERREWGNMYGRIKAIYRGTEKIAEGDEAAWRALLPILDNTNALHSQISRIERVDIGAINAEIEKLRLHIRQLELNNPSPSPRPLPGVPIAPSMQWVNERDRVRGEIAQLQGQIAAAETRYQEQMKRLEALNARVNEYSALMLDANGREKQLPVSQIIRALRPNKMSVSAKSLTYAANVWRVLTEEPREANTEGGIFPAIFGTVMMVFVMTVAVVPFGILAALYLKEYARQGILVRLVRIAVNNLAGVPSIVFGVFGLGFFIYGIGGTIDQLFFPEALPTPTFGTGGILWASLTLALLTVPVVIVATEEGLAAVPRDYREASLGLGATKFETIWNVVLPTAVPAVLTGLILAIARAAGEVAPLMLTGVVKLAPTLPFDWHWPFFHLDRKFMHLGFHIYDVGFQSPNVEAAKPMVYITTLVLLVVVVLLNLIAITLRNRFRKKYAGSAV